MNPSLSEVMRQVDQHDDAVDAFYTRALARKFIGATCAVPEVWGPAPTMSPWTGNCDHCGHRYGDQDRYCPQCGGQLPASGKKGL